MKTLAAKAIFDAARELLIEAKTLDEVTVRKIALRVGTSHTAINYHFGSRDRLIRRVMEKTYLKFNAERLRGNRLAPLLDPRDAASGDP